MAGVVNANAVGGGLLIPLEGCREAFLQLLCRRRTRKRALTPRVNVYLRSIGMPTLKRPTTTTTKPGRQESVMETQALCWHWIRKRAERPEAMDDSKESLGEN